MAATSDLPLINFTFEELNAEEIENLLKPFESPNKRDLQEVDVDQFIDDQKKKNTTVCTEKDVKNVQRWLYDNKREPRLLENIPPNHLNDLLAEMFISIRKTDGNNYEPSSLESIKNSIERYLRDKNYQSSLKDKLFQKCINALNAKKVELKKQGLGRKPNKSFHISPEEEEKMYECGALGDSCPKSLVTTLFYLFGKLFGFRARDEARQVTVGDIEMKQSGSETFLEFQERCTKTRDGTNLKNVRDTPPRIFSSPQIENKRNAIFLYQLYMKKRPQSMMDPESPLFLTPIPVKRLTGKGEEPWYYPRPMGENTLGNLMKDAATMAKLEKKITNHSVRKTTVTTLSRAGVPPQKIMKITAHKNIQTITGYNDELTEGEHKDMCNILQNRPVVSNTPLPQSESVAPEMTVAKPCAAPEKQSFPPGCVFNNCTYNF